MFSEQAALDSIRHRLLKTNSKTGKLLHILGPKLPRCLLDGFWKKKHMSFRIGGLIKKNKKKTSRCFFPEVKKNRPSLKDSRI